jgi:hypothetical protein
LATYVADGTTFARGDGASPEVFTAINQVTDVGTVGSDRGLIDVTNLSSTAREYKKAIKDGQELTLTINYDPDDTGHSGLRTDNDAEVSRNYRVTFSDSPAQTVTFAGLVTNWSVGNIVIDNVLTLSVTVKPTGDLTFA